MNDDKPPSSKSIFPFVNSIYSFFTKLDSKQDLREYLQDAQDNKIIDTEEHAMLSGVLSFSEQRVRDVMLPKSKMVMVSKDMAYEEVIKLVIQSGHSRFPVEQDDDIIGILLAKDLLIFLDNPENPFSITNIMRPVHFIPESKHLDAMLREFRRNRLHIAIVTSEYGDIAGLITIEDAIEEIVGEIDDEHDKENTEDIRKISENLFSVNALTEIEIFNEHFGTDLDIDAHDTISGFVLSNFGYVPSIGDTVEFAGLQFFIKKANERRVIEITVKSLKAEQKTTSHS